jgi:hypothetical protein
MIYANLRSQICGDINNLWSNMIVISGSNSVDIVEKNLPIITWRHGFNLKKFGILTFRFEEVLLHLVSDQLTNGLSFLNKEDICTFCFPQERALPNW